MRRIALWFLTAGLAGVIAGAGPARGATTRSYAVLSSGERIGKLEVVTSGKVVDLDWRIDDNGRGPKIKGATRSGGTTCSGNNARVTSRRAGVLPASCTPDTASACDRERAAG